MATNFSINADSCATIQEALRVSHEGNGNCGGEGQEVLIPPGTYSPNDIYDSNIYNGALLIGQKTILRGAGIGNTVLEFDQNGIYAANTEWNTYDIQITDMTLKYIGSGNSHTGLEIRGDNGVNAGRLVLKNLAINNFSEDGVVIYRPILSQLTNIKSENNVLNGFSITGGGTSTTLKNCYATSNGDKGYLWKDVGYSSLINCAADKNGNGYYIRPNNQVTNLSFFGCGAEKNDNHQFYLSRVWGLTLDSITALPGNNSLSMVFLDGARQTAVSGCYLGHTPDSGASLKISNDNGNMWPSDIMCTSCDFGTVDGTNYDVKLEQCTYTDIT